MGGLNRGRYAVQLDGPWRLYAHIVPPGWRVIGVIIRDSERGALVESPVGILCSLCGGVTSSLDQRKARAAIAAARAPA